MSSGLHLPSTYARIRAGLDLRAKDPLSYWHFGVPRLKQAMGLFANQDPIEELHARSCNKGTKTETMAAYILACTQKREFLDGVRIPRWRGRVEGVQLVLDYKQQLLSVQPAYERLLGQWPHHPRKNGAYMESIHVMPVGGNPDSEADWSPIYFLSQKNLTSGTGVRGDVIGFDEPPVMSILRELRKAAHAGRRSITLIHETPTIRRQWQPIKEDYGDTPRRTLRRIDWRAEVRWSLDEVAPWILSDAEKARLLEKYENDPLKEARIHGDYAITEGASPWGARGLRVLEQLLRECVNPEPFQWRISQEGKDRSRVSRSIPVEIFKAPKVNQSYWVTIDPSSGVEDTAHDPYELQVTEDGTGDLCLRAGGYLPGYLVGVLGVGIAKQYNSAPIDPEVNDRWGVNVVEGVVSCGYANFARERRELKPGEWTDEIGFHNNQNSRPIIIGSVQTWLDAIATGVGYGTCRSKFIINQLLDCILDEKGRIVGAPGVHDDALIVRGQALRRAVRRIGMDIPDARPPVKTRDQLLMEKLRGQEPPTPPGDYRAAKERPKV